MNVSLARYSPFGSNPTFGVVRRRFEINRLVLAFRMPASWNQIAAWLQQIEGLLRAA